MSAFYWAGYALGVALAAAAMLAPVLLVAVRPLRRWWLRPLLRRVTGRRPEAVAARTAGLERELAGRDRLTFMPGIHRQALTCQDIERARQKFLASIGRPPVVLPPVRQSSPGPLPQPGGSSLAYTASGPIVAVGGIGGGGGSCTTVTHSHGPDDPCNSDCRYV